MKAAWHRLSSLLLMAGLMLPMHSAADSDWQDLKDATGRVVRGQIVSYDSNEDTVGIKRADNQLFTVSLDVFSEETQRYIRRWGYEYEFYHSLKISVEPKHIAGPEEDYGVDADEFVLMDVGYVIKLENPTASAFDNPEVLYCLYYQQAKRKDRGQRMVQNGVTCGRFSLDSIVPGAVHMLPTDMVLLYNDLEKEGVAAIELFGREIERLYEARGMVIGLRVRVIITAPSGRRLIREFCEPYELADYTKWTTTSTYSKLNLERQKRLLRGKNVIIQVIEDH